MRDAAHDRHLGAAVGAEQVGKARVLQDQADLRRSCRRARARRTAPPRGRDGDGRLPARRSGAIAGSACSSRCTSVPRASALFRSTAPAAVGPNAMLSSVRARRRDPVRMGQVGRRSLIEPRRPRAAGCAARRRADRLGFCRPARRATARPCRRRRPPAPPWRPASVPHAPGRTSSPAGVPRLSTAPHTTSRSAARVIAT